jgi:O-antigen ligase
MRLWVEPLNVGRASLGISCFLLLAAWLYPYSERAHPDALQYLFMLGAFSLASLFMGMAFSPVVAGLGAAFALVCLFFTPNPYWANGLLGVAGIGLACIGVFTGLLLRSAHQKLSWFLWSVAAAAGLNALEGILQWSDLTGELYRWMVVPEYRGIAFGAFRQTNLFATYMVVGVIAVAWLAALGKISSAMAWLLVAVVTVALAMSRSRTGLLESLAVMVLGLWWCDRCKSRSVRILVGQFFILVVAMYLLPSLADALGFGFESGAGRAAQAVKDERLAIWRNALAMIQVHPWFGWGWTETGYAHYMTLVDQRYGKLLDNVHSLPLQIALEFGIIPATLGLGAAAFYATKHFPWKRVDAQGDTNTSSNSALFAWLIIAVVGIHSMLEYPLWTPGYLYLTGFALGFVMPVSALGIAQELRKNRLTNLPHLIAALLLGLSIVGRWQFDVVNKIYTTPFTNDLVLQRQNISNALANAQGAWMFQKNLDLVRLSLTEINADNAVEMQHLSEKLLHVDAEPHVIQPLLWSYWYQGNLERLRFHAIRFCRAFPDTYQKWHQAKQMQKMIASAQPLPETCLNKPKQR